MVDGIKENPIFTITAWKKLHRLDLLECKDDSCYFNTQKVEFTYPPQKNPQKTKPNRTEPKQNKTMTELKLEKN